MPKNVIFLHLESISNTIFWQYRSEFGTLWRLWLESARFTNFHATATSTKMATEHFHFGSTFKNDYYSFYNDSISQPKCGFSILYSYLRFHGYDYRDYLFDHYFRLESVQGLFHSHNNPERLFADMRQFFTESNRSGKPFAVYFSNQVSHMALDDHAKATAQTFSDRFRLGYKSLDAGVHQLLKILSELGLWENTMIVGFGDHGDEMWSHGLNKGYCHGIPPYASLTRVPLFLYNSGMPPGDNDQLADMTDLKETIADLLIPDRISRTVHPITLDAGPFPGTSIFSGKKKLVFSQNLYALQLEHRDPEEGLYKGYSVTDGDFRLLISSGGNKPKEGGLELFCDKVDPTNSRNLLDFFILGVDGKIIRFSPPLVADDSDFSIVFSPTVVEHLINTYHQLRDSLEKYVREKEELALQYAAGRPHHIMPQKAFVTARKRRRMD